MIQIFDYRTLKKFITIVFICAPILLEANESDIQKTRLVTVTFHGIKEIKGNIRYSFVSEKDKNIFPRPGKKNNGSFMDKVKVIKKGKAVVKLKLPTNQKFAISAYHDLDGNGKFNLFLGCIPKEPYGFSILKNPPLGEPAFSECSFHPLKTNEVDVYF